MKLGTSGAERTFWVREHRKARLNSRFDAESLLIRFVIKSGLLNNLLYTIVKTHRQTNTAIVGMDLRLYDEYEGKLTTGGPYGEHQPKHAANTVSAEPGMVIQLSQVQGDIPHLDSGHPLFSGI